jgi:hypothetical protein
MIWWLIATCCAFWLGAACGYKWHERGEFSAWEGLE